MAGTENSEETFRVRVSLERFFGDERARCYVSVQGARRVRWLSRRLRRLFPLPRRLALLSRGHLLPPDEPLALLQPDDPVEVIPATVVDEIDGDIQSATGDIIEASTPVPAEPSPSSKRRRKDQQIGANNAELLVSMDTSITLPVSAENGTQKDKSKELPQEELSVETLTDYKKSQNNKHHFIYDSISKETNVVLTASTDNIGMEQDSWGLSQKPESDSERMRQLKEQALAVLEQVAARPRRRARVRRRRRREPLPEHFCAADSAATRPAEAAATSGSVASSPLEPIPEYLGTGADSSSPARLPEALDPTIEPVTVMPRRDDDSTSEDTTDASQPVPVPAAAGAVLRNTSAAPRAARLVRSLVDVAPAV